MECSLSVTGTRGPQPTKTVRKFHPPCSQARFMGYVTTVLLFYKFCVVKWSGQVVMFGEELKRGGGLGKKCSWPVFENDIPSLESNAGEGHEESLSAWPVIWWRFEAVTWLIKAYNFPARHLLEIVQKCLVYVYINKISVFIKLRLLSCKCSERGSCDS
jgi:hypothetical protein